MDSDLYQKIRATVVRRLEPKLLEEALDYVHDVVIAVLENPGADWKFALFDSIRSQGYGRRGIATMRPYTTAYKETDLVRLDTTPDRENKFEEWEQEADTRAEIERLFADLSPRQLVVCEMLASGLTQRQVAERLGVHETAISLLLKRIRKKVRTTKGPMDGFSQEAS